MKQTYTYKCRGIQLAQIECISTDHMRYIAQDYAMQYRGYIHVFFDNMPVYHVRYLFNSDTFVVTDTNKFKGDFR